MTLHILPFVRIDRTLLLLVLGALSVAFLSFRLMAPIDKYLGGLRQLPAVLSDNRSRRNELLPTLAGLRFRRRPHVDEL